MYAGPYYQAPTKSSDRRVEHQYGAESAAYAQQMAMYNAQHYPGAFYPGMAAGYPAGYPGMAPPPQFFNSPPEPEETPRPQASQRRITKKEPKKKKREWNPFFAKGD